MRQVFGYCVDYDEMVNELYVYLMAEDAVKLRSFQFRSSVYQWLKVLSIRFFIKKRSSMVENISRQPIDASVRESVSLDAPLAENDIEHLFDSMPNKRYVTVIRRLVLEGWEPERLASEMNVTTANLYNIKRRAMAQLAQVALNDIKEYGKKR
jgi:DNA-directed RNA polymerase specialized sigma24 family protein